MAAVNAGRIFGINYKIQCSIAALIRCQRYASQGTTSSGKTPRQASSPSLDSSGPSGIPDVPGLSSACVATPSGEIGPGISKAGEYKNPEYFCFSDTTYYEAEIEMAKYRIPQPASGRK